MLTILVPIKKWLESVGRNFKWSVCNGPVFTASRVTLRARQEQRGGEKCQTRGQRLQRSRPNMNCATVEHDTASLHTAHIGPRISSHQMLKWQTQQAAVHNKQDRMTTPEQLRSTGQRHCGVFWAQRLAVTDDHHKLFINLTSQQWGGRSCEVALLCPRAWALQEREREAEAGTTCARKMSVFVEKEGVL